MSIITLYNHKGGVSKTTTTFNLGRLLSAQGKKVLFVDADPQCNLTEICLAQNLIRMDEEAEASDNVELLPGSTILDALQPRLAGETATVDVDKIETVSIDAGLDLLRGSVNLALIEDELSEAHVQRFSNRANLMRTYVAIGDMLVRLEEKRGYDYILIDVGPSAGVLTRFCFLSCDAFFVPVAADNFNVQAIQTLSVIIDSWMAEHSQIRDTYKELSLPVRPGKPMFLGLVSQFFKIYKGRPKQGYAHWTQLILNGVEQSIAPVMEKHSTDGANLLPFGKEYLAAEIQDFGSLAPLMQITGKAVFDISQDDTAQITETGAKWSGQTWTDAVERMSVLKGCYQKLAQRLEVVK